MQDITTTDNKATSTTFPTDHLFTDTKLPICIHYPCLSCFWVAIAGFWWQINCVPVPNDTHRVTHFHPSTVHLSTRRSSGAFVSALLYVDPVCEQHEALAYGWPRSVPRSQNWFMSRMKAFCEWYALHWAWCRKWLIPNGMKQLNGWHLERKSGTGVFSSYQNLSPCSCHVSVNSVKSCQRSTESSNSALTFRKPLPRHIK